MNLYHTSGAPSAAEPIGQQTMASIRTFLAAGQRYVPVGCSPWRLDQQVTIVLVARGACGRPRVTSRAADGREFAADAVRVEAAILAGQLIPVTGSGRLAHC
jgi:hypothetical protein